MTLRLCAVASIAVVAALPAVAKDKPQPAPDWAVTASKTPTPANVQDAPAVVLFDEYLISVDEHNRAVERELQRAVQDSDSSFGWRRSIMCSVSIVRRCCGETPTTACASTAFPTAW